jgi:hypothetical protein
MYKKIIVPLILALVAGLTLSNVAYAATDASTASFHRVGTILSVDTAAQIIKIATNNGERLVFHVYDSTNYRGKISSFSELASGMYVHVTATTLSDGSNLALKVNVLKVVVKAKVTGKITSSDASSFTITGNDGNSYTFQIAAKMTVSGNGIANYKGLETGMKVRVTYTNLGIAGLRAMDINVLKK